MSVADVVLVAAGYLVGSLPFGYWIVRVARGEDIREHGSGNVGASNVMRVYGWRLGAPVALLDVAKGFVAAFVGLKLGGETVGVLVGAAAMVGHARPLFLRFQKGGKMVATAGGVTFALAPFVALICVGVWVVTFLVFRYASLASLATSLALPFLCVVLGEPAATILFATFACIAAFVLHRQNIRRLVAGTESRATLRRAAGA